MWIFRVERHVNYSLGGSDINVKTTFLSGVSELKRKAEGGDGGRRKTKKERGKLRGMGREREQ